MPTTGLKTPGWKTLPCLRPPQVVIPHLVAMPVTEKMKGLLHQPTLTKGWLPQQSLCLTRQGKERPSPELLEHRLTAILVFGTRAGISESAAMPMAASISERHVRSALGLAPVRASQPLISTSVMPSTGPA